MNREQIQFNEGSHLWQPDHGTVMAIPVRIEWPGLSAVRNERRNRKEQCVFVMQGTRIPINSESV